MTLLTVDDLRLWPAFATTDSTVLDLLLDAEEQAIERELGGPVGTVVEVVDGGALSYLTLRRRAASIGSVGTVIDGFSTTLDATDWRLRGDRRTIQRLGTGTNPSALWGGLVTVAYEPEDDSVIRMRVQRELVALDLTVSPGATSEQIGAWLEMQQKSSVWNEQAERAAILSTLWPTEGIDFA